MLSIKNINKVYDGKKVLDDISLDVESGKIYALLGLNGAGKSTLMKIVCGLAFPDSGEITLDGKSLLDDKDRTSKIGFMIEMPAFYRELSGKQNLEALAILYDDIDKKRVDEVLMLTGMHEQANVAVKKYSLGMKQRLYLAYAILSKPRLLVLDEPFNGIDPVTINLFKNLILELAKNGCIVLISGHVITEIQSISDSAVIIDNGKIVYRDEACKGKDLTEIFLNTVSDAGLVQ